MIDIITLCFSFLLGFRLLHNMYNLLNVRVFANVFCPLIFLRLNIYSLGLNITTNNLDFSTKCGVCGCNKQLISSLIKRQPTISHHAPGLAFNGDSLQHPAADWILWCFVKLDTKLNGRDCWRQILRMPGWSLISIFTDIRSDRVSKRCRLLYSQSPWCVKAIDTCQHRVIAWSK